MAAVVAEETTQPSTATQFAARLNELLSFVNDRDTKSKRYLTDLTIRSFLKLDADFGKKLLVAYTQSLLATALGTSAATTPASRSSPVQQVVAQHQTSQVNATACQ